MPPCRQCRGVEWPIQLTVRTGITQHRHARSIPGFQRGMPIDEHRIEIRKTRLGEHGQGLVTQLAVITLVQDEHRQGSDGFAAAQPRMRCGNR